MFGQRPPQQSPLIKVLDWLSMVAAFMIALLGAPYLNALSQDFVLDIARGSYPPGVVSFIRFSWMVSCFPLSFFAARAALNVSLIMIGVMLGKRV